MYKGPILLHAHPDLLQYRGVDSIIIEHSDRQEEHGACAPVAGITHITNTIMCLFIPGRVKLTKTNIYACYGTKCTYYIKHQGAH